MEQPHSFEPTQEFKLVLPVGEYKIQILIEDVWGAITKYFISDKVEVRIHCNLYITLGKLIFTE